MVKATMWLNSKYLLWVELFRKKNNKWVIFLAQRSPYSLHYFNNFVNINSRFFLGEFAKIINVWSSNNINRDTKYLKQIIYY